MNKICLKCKVPQDIENFTTDSSKKDNHRNYCNTCVNTTQRLWYAKNKEKARKQAMVSYEKNKETIKLRRRQDLKNNPEKHKAARQKYYDPKKSKMNAWKNAGIINMTHEYYDELLKSQDNKCAICKTHQQDLKRTLSVDHDHNTGKVRGLLCDNCNRALGYFKDDTSILEVAKNYLLWNKQDNPHIG